MTTTKESALLSSALRKQIKEYNNEARSFRSAFLNCVRAERVANLLKFYEAAGVPAADCSANEACSWDGYAKVKNMLPHYTDAAGAFHPLALTNKADAAMLLTEAVGVESIECMQGVQREVLATAVEGALKEARFFVEKTVKTCDTERTVNADGSITIVKSNFREETKRMYITYSDGKVTQKQINMLFLDMLGVPAAIADAKLAELEAAQARQILKIEKEKARLEKQQAAAAEAAEKLQRKAAEKAAKAEKLQAEAKQSLAKAAEIHAKAAAKEGEAIANNAETFERTKQRKKTNTRTKASQQINK